MLATIRSIDTALFLFFNRSIANPAFDLFFTLITNPRNWLIPSVILAGFYIRSEKKRAIIPLALAILTFAITDPLAYRVLKPLFGRLRPCHPDALIEGARYLIGHKRSFSLPSNHATNMFGLAMLFSLFYPRRAVWFLVTAGLIAFSRVYVGVHYPLDITAGAVLGVGVGAAVYYGYRAAAKRFAKHATPDEQPTGPVDQTVE